VNVTDPDSPISRQADLVRGDLELLARFSGAYGSLEPRKLEVEAEALRVKLSPESAKLFTAILRRRIAPIVAAMVEGVCAACNVAVPTGLASSILANRGVHVCLRCKRILLPAGEDQPFGRRATGSAR
jgi:predicted  nucleic acid-binding Zn-ribbon protein